jgi:aryl-alcohol dehydrogenase-like predicted oxidoreductase
MKIDRRHFLGPVAGAAAMVGPTFGESKQELPQVTLAGGAVKMTRLGFGTGTVGRETKQSIWAKRNKRLERVMSDQDAVALFHRAYERGITFFDMADVYGTHPFCREALKDIPREKVALMTKFWWQHQAQGGDLLAIPVKERETFARKAFDRYRRELNTDYIDMLLLHCLTQPKWVEEMQPYMDVFSEYKEQGLIKTLGCSCHNYGAMETAADCSWVDILLARINPEGVRCDGSADEVLKVLREAKRKGKFVIGMKVYGAGDLLSQRDACMKFAQECGVQDALTLGVKSVDEMNENLSLMEKYPVV